MLARSSCIGEWDTRAPIIKAPTSSSKTDLYVFSSAVGTSPAISGDTLAAPNVNFELERTAMVNPLWHLSDNGFGEATPSAGREGES